MFSPSVFFSVFTPLQCNSPYKREKKERKEEKLLANSRSSFNIYNLIHFHRRENLCCISFAPFPPHSNAFFKETVKSPFFAYASALNSQPRLFIYFIFIPSDNPQHNLTKHKKRFRLAAPLYSARKKQLWNPYFYTCLLSHLMKQNV